MDFRLQFKGKRFFISTVHLLMISCWVSSASAQTFNKDSLVDAGYHQKNLSKRIEALLLLSEHYNSFYQDLAVKYAGDALVMAESYHLTGGVVHAYYALSDIYLNTKDLAKTREYIEKGIAYSEKRNYTDGMIEGCMHYSFMYQEMGKSDSMMYFSIRALNLSKLTKNVEIQAGVAHDIGNIYSYQGDYDKALYYCRLSLDTWIRIGHKNIAGILSDIGNIYYSKKDYDSALIYYKKAYANANANNDALAYGYSLNNIGLVYYNLDSLDKAMEYYQKSIGYYKLDLNKQGIANAENNLGYAFLKKGDNNEALKHALKSLSLASDQDFKRTYLESYSLMAEAEARLKNYQLAWQYQKKASGYQDTLNKLTMNKKVADFETKFEIERADNENKLLLEKEREQKEELKRQNQVTLFIGIIMLLCIIIASLAINNSNKRKRELTLLEKLNGEISEQKKKLEEANEIKTKLFSIVSHDFKSPLASLQLFLSLLESGDFDQEEIKEFSQKLMERMNITFSFLENLLGWAQSQLEGYQPVLANVALHEIVEETFDLYKRQAQAKKINLHDKIAANENIVTDENMIKLVLRNLISNALKYTHTDGDITVDLRRESGNIIISVADTGIGMNEDMIRKIFTNERVNTTGTAEEAGTGLGLMLCKEFVERNGGTIRVQSEVGRGSIFSFSIPDRQKP